MYYRNVSKLLITMVESNFISLHDYEYIVCAISEYIPDNYEKGDEVNISPGVCPDEDGYDDSYGLDVDGWAHWTGNAEKNRAILVIDSPGFKIELELTPDELSEIWQGFDLDMIGKRLALGYIESYISSNNKLSIVGLNAVIPGYCYAKVTVNDELVIVFSHDDFNIEHFFPNILAAGSKNDLHSTYKCNTEWF